MTDKQSLLSIHIVTWNSASVIRDLLESLQRQDFTDFSLTVVDNASTDDTLQIVTDFFPHATIIRNIVNRGFCGAHNQAISISHSEYVAIINPDLIFLPHSLSTIMQRVQQMPEVGCMGAKLLKSTSHSGMIDSAGIEARTFRRFVNRGEGMADSAEYSVAKEVFAVSGAFMVLRRKALDSIAVFGEYLDEDIFAYKDEIDLAWRLRLAGWKIWYEPSSHILHKRTAKHEQGYSLHQRRQRKSALVNQLSYRNHILVLLKNDDYQEWLNPFRSPLVYEFAKFLYILLFEWSTLPAIWQTLRLMPRMISKRRHTSRISSRVSAVNQWLH